MKNLTALFAVAALTLAAGAAQADVRPDQIPSLLESGAVKQFEQLNSAALVRHTGATINDTELDHEAGRLVYEVDLTDTTGKKWDVTLDAKTGEVLQDKQDT
jgi:uncharacterized membrane protein YkoI